MKALFILLISLAAFGQSKPVSLKGLQDTAYQLPKQEIQVPNRQYTNTGGLSGLIETGNSNLLANPSFEHSTFSTGWTSTGFTGVETLVVQDGRKSFSLTGIASFVEVRQDSTINAAQFANQQGLAYCRVRTNVAATHELCARSNGAYQAGTCVEIVPSAVLELYAVPFIMGGTSNGVGVRTKVNNTANVIVDDCYVGIIKPGMITETGAVGPWISYTPTFTGFGTVTVQNFRYRVVGSSIEIEGGFTSGTPTGVEARVSLPSGFTSSSSVSTIQLSGYAQRGVTATSVQFGILSEPSVAYLTFSTLINVTVGLVKKVGTEVVNAGDTLSFFASVPIAGLSSRVSLYSQQCRKPSDCENVFSAKVSAAGVVSGENIDFINGNAAITDTSLFTYTFTSGIFTVTPNCVVTADVSSSSFLGGQIEASSSSSLAMRIKTGGGTNVAVGHIITCTKSPPDYKERNMITGTFRDVVTSTTTNGLINVSVFRVGQGTKFSNCTSSPCTVYPVSGIMPTSVTRTSNGLYVINYATGFSSQEIHCQGQAVNKGARQLIFSESQTVSPTTTTYTFETRQDTGTIEDGNSQITCWGTP